MKVGCSLSLLERSGVSGASGQQRQSTAARASAAAAAAQYRPMLRCVAATDEQADFLLGKGLDRNTAAVRQASRNDRLCPGIFSLILM